MNWAFIGISSSVKRLCRTASFNYNTKKADYVRQKLMKIKSFPFSDSTFLPKPSSNTYLILQVSRYVLMHDTDIFFGNRRQRQLLVITNGHLSKWCSDHTEHFLSICPEQGVKVRRYGPPVCIISQMMARHARPSSLNSAVIFRTDRNRHGRSLQRTADSYLLFYHLLLSSRVTRWRQAYLCG